jgi:hypothetical protein
MARFTMLSAAILSAAMIAILAGAKKAEAFSVTNQTDFTVCVSGNRGNYSELIFPHSQGTGWDLNDNITLSFTVYDEAIQMEESGEMYIVCNNSMVTSCQVPPHQAEVIDDVMFWPGGVSGSTNKAGAWASYALGLAAGYFVNAGSGCTTS